MLLRTLHRHITYANVASVLAIVAVTGGSAWAAARKPAAAPARISGANVVASSLTGLDFRNGTIEATDFSTVALSSMRGRRGAAGERGTTGPVGAQGPTGQAGAAGGAAHSLVRFATQSSEFLRANTTSAAPNGSSPVDWDDAAYAAYANGDSNVPGAAPGTHPNIAENYSSSSSFPTTITANEPVVVQLTGNNQSTTGTIRPTSAGLLTATATLTIMHSSHSEVDWDAGRPLHSRVRCTLRYANNGQPIGSGSPKLGTAEWLSTRAKHKLFTITMTGSEKVAGSASANYNVGVSCADVDSTGSNQWTFVAGSVTAHSIYVES